MEKFSNFLTRLPAYCLSILCSIIILYLTLVPNPLPDNRLQLIPGMDKIVHAIMFGGFVLCLGVDYRRKHPFSKLSVKKMISYICFGIFFGAIVELLQYYMNVGRGGDYLDLASDAIGCIIFGFLIIPVNRWLGFDRKS